MFRTSRWLILSLVVASLLTVGAGQSRAQVVVAYYPAPAPVCYTAPAVSYYAPAVPAVSYYAAPAVSYYAAPAVSYYAAPARAYYAPAATSTTYRRGLFGRRSTTVTNYYTPGYVYP